MTWSFGISDPAHAGQRVDEGVLVPVDRPELELVADVVASVAGVVDVEVVAARGRRTGRSSDRRPDPRRGSSSPRGSGCWARRSPRTRRRPCRRRWGRASCPGPRGGSSRSSAKPRWHPAASAASSARNRTPVRRLEIRMVTPLGLAGIARSCARRRRRGSLRSGLKVLQIGPICEPVASANRLREGPQFSVLGSHVSERELDDLGRRVAARRLPRVAPGSASRRTSARATGPWRGETTAVPTVPTTRSPSRSSSPCGAGGREAQSAQVAVRLALVVQARDGLLAHVAALREGHRPLVEAGLLRDDRVVEVDAVARAPGLHAQHLGRGLVHVRGAAGAQRGRQRVGVGRVADQVDARRRWRRGGPRSRRPRRARWRAPPPAGPRRRRRRAPRGRSATAARARPCACAARRRSRSGSGGSC